MGSLREAGERRAGDGMTRGCESGEIGNEFCHIAKHFAIEKAHTGRNH